MYRYMCIYIYIHIDRGPCREVALDIELDLDMV